MISSTSGHQKYMTRARHVPSKRRHSHHRVTSRRTNDITTRVKQHAKSDEAASVNVIVMETMQSDEVLKSPDDDYDDDSEEEECDDEDDDEDDDDDDDDGNDYDDDVTDMGAVETEDARIKSSALSEDKKQDCLVKRGLRSLLAHLFSTAILCSLQLSTLSRSLHGNVTRRSCGSRNVLRAVVLVLRHSTRFRGRRKRYRCFVVIVASSSVVVVTVTKLFSLYDAAEDVMSSWQRRSYFQIKRNAHSRGGDFLNGTIFRAVNCDAIAAGDLAEIRHVEIMLFKEPQYQQMRMNTRLMRGGESAETDCTQWADIISRESDNHPRVQQNEANNLNEEHSVAFTVTIPSFSASVLARVRRLLRAVYSPHNVYCLAVTSVQDDDVLHDSNSQNITYEATSREVKRPISRSMSRRLNVKRRMNAVQSLLQGISSCLPNLAYFVETSSSGIASRPHGRGENRTAMTSSIRGIAEQTACLRHLVVASNNSGGDWLTGKMQNPFTRGNKNKTKPGGLKRRWIGHVTISYDDYPLLATGEIGPRLKWLLLGNRWNDISTWRLNGVSPSNQTDTNTIKRMKIVKQKNGTDISVKEFSKINRIFEYDQCSLEGFFISGDVADGFVKWLETTGDKPPPDKASCPAAFFADQKINVRTMKQCSRDGDTGVRCTPPIYRAADLIGLLAKSRVERQTIFAHGFNPNVDNVVIDCLEEFRQNDHLS